MSGEHEPAKRASDIVLLLCRPSRLGLRAIVQWLSFGHYSVFIGVRNKLSSTTGWDARHPRSSQQVSKNSRWSADLVVETGVVLTNSDNGLAFRV